MSPPVDPVQSDPSLPARTTVVIVGGGIVGVCTAFFLAREGIPVVLCEKGEIAAEQSSRNWGWCRKMGRDPREMPLAIEAMRLWNDMNKLIEAESGFRRSGIVYLCRTQRDLARRARWLEQVGQPHQIDSRLLTRDQMAIVTPGLAGNWAGALSTPSDGRAEPAHAAPAIAEAARRHGAILLTQCAVRGIETEGGRISGVITEKGPIACEQVVLAGGVWSRLFCGNLGLRLPQLKVTSAVMRIDPVVGGPETSTGGPGFGLRKRLDGGYTVGNWSRNTADLVPDSARFSRDFLRMWWLHRKETRLGFGRAWVRESLVPRRWKPDQVTPFEKLRILDPVPSERILEQAKQRLIEAFPMMHRMRISDSWGGAVDVTPDGLPVISPVDTIPGFFIATGFTGHGFGISPGAGKLMAQLVSGQAPMVDPTPFRYSRFAERPRSRPSPLA
ncbi:MAG: FAD-binding oxidoreductase [Acetobacteraceae bacterium]|nr:FAD-binding oxidoreductase [Acetobacteraceae bacterium]